MGYDLDKTYCAELPPISWLDVVVGSSYHDIEDSEIEDFTTYLQNELKLAFPCAYVDVEVDDCTNILCSAGYSDDSHTGAEEEVEEFVLKLIKEEQWRK